MPHFVASEVGLQFLLYDPKRGLSYLKRAKCRRQAIVADTMPS